MGNTSLHNIRNMTGTHNTSLPVLLLNQGPKPNVTLDGHTMSTIVETTINSAVQKDNLPESGEDIFGRSNPMSPNSSHPYNDQTERTESEDKKSHTFSTAATLPTTVDSNTPATRTNANLAPSTSAGSDPGAVLGPGSEAGLEPDTVIGSGTSFYSNSSTESDVSSGYGIVSRSGSKVDIGTDTFGDDTSISVTGADVPLESFKHNMHSSTKPSTALQMPDKLPNTSPNLVLTTSQSAATVITTTPIKGNSVFKEDALSMEHSQASSPLPQQSTAAQTTNHTGVYAARAATTTSVIEGEQGNTTRLYSDLITTDTSATLSGSSSKHISVIVAPTVIGILVLIAVSISLGLLYRARRNHKKTGTIKYKRYLHNGEATVPLATSYSECYKFNSDTEHVSACEVDVYAEIVQSKAPRAIHREKRSKELETDNTDDGDCHTFIKQGEHRSKKTRHSNGHAPLISFRSSPESSGHKHPPKTAKRIPDSPRKEISWPISLSGAENDSPSISVKGVSATSQNSSPEVPPRGYRSSPEVPPRGQSSSPEAPLRGQSSSPEVPPRAQSSSPQAPPRGQSSPNAHPRGQSTSPEVQHVPYLSPSHIVSSMPVGPRSVNVTRHEYDPVYVPRSDANAINRRLDTAGYVTSRRMRMAEMLRQDPYEDVNVYSEIDTNTVMSAQQTMPHTRTQQTSTPTQRASPHVHELPAIPCQRTGTCLLNGNVDSALDVAENNEATMNSSDAKITAKHSELVNEPTTDRGCENCVGPDYSATDSAVYEDLSDSDQETNDNTRQSPVDELYESVKF